MITEFLFYSVIGRIFRGVSQIGCLRIEHTLFEFQAWGWDSVLAM